MNIIKIIAKNTLVLTIGQIGVIILGTLYNIYTARYLGAEGYGILSFSLAFTGIFGLLADLGLSTLATREISRDISIANKYIGNIIVIKLILSLITMILTATAVYFLNLPTETSKVVYLIFLPTIFISFTGIFNSIFQAFQKMEYISAGKILNSVLMLIGTLVAINQNFDLIHFVLIYFIVNFIVLGYSFCICIYLFVIPAVDFDLSLWKKLLKESIPFWLTNVFIIIYFRIDQIMLSMMEGNDVVGWYSASYRLIDGLSILPSVLMSVMFPVFSKYHENSKDSLELAFKKTLKFLTILAIPIGIGTTITAEKIIQLIYGTDYMPSVVALKILVWASVLSFINFTPATLLNSTNKQKLLMKITCFGAILNIILNYILIPSFSYKGAGIATVFTEFFVGIFIMYHIQKTQKTFLSSFYEDITKSLMSGIVMGTFLIIVYNNCSLLLLIVAASLIYFIILIETHIFGKEDIDIFNQALGRR